MVTIYVDNMRREKDAQLRNHSITLQIETINKLNAMGVTSARGKGNLSAFLEIAALIACGLFDNPELAKRYLLDLIEVEPNMWNEIRALAENLEETAKRLYDSLE